MSNSFCQVTPEWVWARDASGSGNDKSFGLDIDSQNNILMAGFFYSDLSFDNITLSASIGYPDFYIAKYSPDGLIIWAKQGYGTREDQAYDVVCDEDDNVIVTGVFGMFSSNGILIDTISLSNAGAGDMFLAKYNSYGDLIWAIKEGGPAREWGRSVDVDMAGNIYVCGNFTNGNSNLGGNIIVNNSDYGFFICKYSSSGILLWYKVGNTPDRELIRNISVFPETGNIYAFGDFEDNYLTLDSVTIYNHNESELDNFLFKLDSNGNVLWGNCIGGNLEEKGNYCTIDVRENVYVTGNYKSNECYIGLDTLFNPSINQSDTYIAMYSYLGNFEWSHSISGNDSEIAYSITSDTSDFIFVTGYFNSSTIEIGGQTFTNNGSYDIFVAKYDYQSGFHWATTVGGSGSEKANVITINHNRELFVAGEFTSQLLQFDSTSLFNTSGEDIFMAKLKDYCEMPDVFLGNDTILYYSDELIIEIPGYLDYIWNNGSTGSSISVSGADFNTGYTPITVAVMDSSGCVSEDALLLTICNYPVEFLGSDTSIYANQEIILDAGIGYNDFIWNTGDISSSILINGSTNGIGLFSFWVNTSDQYGCIGNDTIQINILPEIGISEMISSDIKVYPTPADEKIFLELDDIADFISFKIYDSSLRVIKEESVFRNTKSLVIDTSELANGIYFLQILSEKKRETVSFVVNHPQ